MYAQILAAVMGEEIYVPLLCITKRVAHVRRSMDLGAPAVMSKVHCHPSVYQRLLVLPIPIYAFRMIEPSINNAYVIIPWRCLCSMLIVSGAAQFLKFTHVSISLVSATCKDLWKVTPIVL